MRLTLRTLLAYLDDTLEPAQAKLIGQKVAESDTAQELIARIKEVTRRRRLTTPPTTGPGGKLDANTAAEYLNDTLSADQLAEVEQVCLASDVHLAEIAACHQILTLVQGEPVLIPPSSKQRMYALVKGPESVPFRKPPGSSEDEDEEAPDQGPDTDETLRLGLPAYRQRGSWSSRLAVFGGGMAAALLLALAIWQALRSSAGPGGDAAEPGSITQTGPENKGDAGLGPAKSPLEKIVQVPKKLDNPPDPGKTGEPDVKQDGPDSDPKKGGTDPGKSNKDDGKKVGKPDGDKEPPKKDEPVKSPDRPLADAPPGPPSMVQREVGRYLPQDETGLSLLVQRGPKDRWRILDGKDPAVYSGKALVSLPGFQSVVQLSSGLRLTLWGNVREMMFQPPVRESMVVLHAHDILDLDLTLRRGRIVLSNYLKQPLRARIRIDNPTNADFKEVWDVTLEPQETEVLFDLWGFYPREERFYPDPKDTRRAGPTAAMQIVVLKGSMSLHHDNLTFGMKAPHGTGPSPAYMPWDSATGTGKLSPVDKLLPEWTTGQTPLPPGVDPRARELRAKILAAVKAVHTNLVGRGEKIDVALAGTLAAPEPTDRVMVVRCYGALDDLPNLLDALGEDSDRQDVRMTAIDVLRAWIASGRDNDYKVFDELRRKNYSNIEAANILTHLHSYSEKEAAEVNTYDTLIDYLNSPKIALRELAGWHLYGLAGQVGGRIVYRAAAPPQERAAAQREWQKLLTTGKLPPRPMPPPQ